MDGLQPLEAHRRLELADPDAGLRRVPDVEVRILQHGGAAPEVRHDLEVEVAAQRPREDRPHAPQQEVVHGADDPRRSGRTVRRNGRSRAAGAGSRRSPTAGRTPRPPPSASGCRPASRRLRQGWAGLLPGEGDALALLVRPRRARRQRQRERPHARVPSRSASHSTVSPACAVSEPHKVDGLTRHSSAPGCTPDHRLGSAGARAARSRRLRSTRSARLVRSTMAAAALRTSRKRSKSPG